MIYDLMSKSWMEKLKIWWVGAAGWLAACGDEPSRSVGPNSTAPATATISAATPSAAATSPTSGQVATPINPVAPTSSPSPALSPTALATPTPTIQPPTPTPTVAPFEPRIASIGVSGGYAFAFAGDGRLVYYEKSVGESRAGSWALNLPSGQKSFLTAGIGTFSSDLGLAALSNRATATATIEDLAAGRRLATLSNRGSPALISPDQRQVAWLLRSLQQDGIEAPQRFELWVAGIDGANPRAVWAGRELANLAWFPDSRQMLVTGRDIANRRFGLWAIDSLNRAANLLVESKGLTVAALSGDGKWLAWWIALQGPAQSGVWVGQADGTQSHKLDWVGGFRWSGGAELFYIPQRQAGEIGSALWSYDPLTSRTTRLTDPTRLPLKIALDQWQPAPDARSLVFRNATDNALWQLSYRR